MVRDKQELWASGAFIGDDAYHTALENARAVAECNAARYIIELSLNDLEEPDEQ